MTQHAYSVHPGQMKRAMSALAAQGADIDGYGRAANGMVVIVVNLPDNVPAPDWQRQPPRRAMSADALRWAIAIAVIVAVVAAGAFVFLRADIAPVAPQPTQPAGLLDGLRLPWDNKLNGEPVVEHVASRWRWPWEAAGDALADAMATVQNTVNIVAGTPLFVLIALIALSVMRKVRR